jgi:hypothetical protein
MAVDLIPGTALPLHTGPGGYQTEGRGDVTITPQRHPPALVEGNPVPDEISENQRRLVDAAIRAFDRSPNFERVIADQTVAQSDATTGNLAMELWVCPQGWEADVGFVLADCPNLATVTPTAPFANAASWSYLAILPASTGRGVTAAADITAGTLRNGLIDFAPKPPAAGGPMLPFMFGPYGNDSGPRLQGGDSLWYVQVGGSQANLVAKTIRAAYRINCWSHR